MKKLSVLLVIIWMIIIFMFSNTVAVKSTAQSDNVYHIINKIIKIDDKYIHTCTKIIRKSAHFFVYFVLGILVINACRYYNYKDLIKLSVLICILYACSDEIHQLFVQGRSGSIIDVLIDSTGSILGIYSYKKLKK